MQMPQVKNLIPQATALPATPPDPVKIDKDAAPKAKRNRNPLRINLAGGGPAQTGVNV
jgi:hypothetical protein